MVCDYGGDDGGEGRQTVDDVVTQLEGEVENVSDEEGKLVEEFQGVRQMQ